MNLALVLIIGAAIGALEGASIFFEPAEPYKVEILLAATLKNISAAWLYDLLVPHVTELLVCNPRKSASLKDGNKNDRIDARKLAEFCRQ